MTRVMLPGVAKCSQMDDPERGTGSGGDRCSEAVATMIDVTYKIGPSAQNGIDPEKIMYDFVAWLNNGATVSKLEDPAWIADWVRQHSNGTITLSKTDGATFADCKACVDRGHIAVVQVRDYSALRTFDNQNPYTWNPANQHVGHVLLLLGYDEDFRGTGPTLIVNDPLRGLPGQPWDYSWASVKAAGPDTLWEVNGPALLPAPPPPPPDPRDAEIASLKQQLAAWQAWLASAPKSS